MTAIGSNTCPFCGGQVYLHEKGIEDNTFDVQCLDCGMEFYYQEVFQMAMHHRGQDIRTRVNKSFHDVWNMRASDADLLAKVERLERERDAALVDLREAVQKGCWPSCKHSPVNSGRKCWKRKYECHGCREDCACRLCKVDGTNDFYEWRGVKED